MSNQRVIVTTFDAVAQADLWLNVGADAAVQTFAAALRTALLLGVDIVVDRNQVLDGICFLALGPEGVADVLGLDHRHRLPLVVNCEPLGDRQATGEMVLRLRGATEGLNHHPGEKAVSLGFQAAQVRSDKFRSASSALAALGEQEVERPWLVPPPGPRWYKGDAFTDLLHPLGESDREGAEKLLEEAQERWFAAMADGRVAVDLWGGRMDMDTALAHQQELLNDACGGEVAPHPLALRILQERSSVRKDALATLQELHGEAEHTYSDEELRLALTLWTRGYYDAIAAKDNSLLLAINLDPGRPSGQDADPNLARRFGLALPLRSSWQRFWERRTAHPQANRVRIDGELLDLMATIHPVSYRQLADGLSRIRRDSALIEPSAVHDIVVAAREIAWQPTPARVVRARVRRRVAVGVVVAVALTWLGLLTDLSQLSDTMTVLALVSAALIGLLAGLPWSDMMDEARMRDSAMTATLSVRRT